MEVTFLMFLSLIIIMLGIVILITKINLVEVGIKSMGEIIDIIVDEEDIIDTFNNRVTLKVYKPMVKFNTLEGEERKAVLDLVKRENDIEIGEKINILYYDNKLNNITVNSRKYLYRFPVLLISLGIMLFTFSIILGIN